MGRLSNRNAHLMSVFANFPPLPILLIMFMASSMLEYLTVQNSGSMKSLTEFTLQTFRDICKLWGVPVAEDKTVEPTEILTFLGIEFDTLAMELRLPNEKLVELKHTLELSVIPVTPLYSDKKVNQTLISSRIDFDWRILWWGFLILHVASISLLQNALPLFGAGADSPKCQFTLQTFRDICKLWGDPVAEDKTVEPTEILAFLGMRFSYITCRINKPPAKRPTRWHDLTREIK
jgi:hypothetical protein